jgi:hypothetical protein
MWVAYKHNIILIQELHQPDNRNPSHNYFDTRAHHGISFSASYQPINMNFFIAQALALLFATGSVGEFHAARAARRHSRVRRECANLL